MYRNLRIVAVIPARKSSKGIKNKNLRKLGGISLLEHTINHALESNVFFKIIVSTDSSVMKKIASNKGLNVNSYRPEVLSNDYARTVDVIRYEIENYNLIEEADCIVVLQPTSPLRNADDIIKSIDRYIYNECKSVMSVSESREEIHLYRLLSKDGTLKKLYNVNSGVRRQDAIKTFKINGAIYVNTINDYLDKNLVLNDNLIPYIMSQDRAIDIDELEDLKVARRLFKLLRKPI